MQGVIALVGGGEFLPAARSLDAWLLERSGSRRVTVLPTAAARQRPELAIAHARRHFSELGAEVEPVMVLDRAEAEDGKAAERLAGSALIYCTGGDPNHLVRVLRNSAVWKGIREATNRGGVLAGSSAGGMVLGAWMLVPGWDRAERGLGLVDDLLLVPHYDRLTDSERSGFLRRVAELIPEAGKPEFRVVGVDESTGLILEDGQSGRALGAGSAIVYRGGEAFLDEGVEAPGSS